MSKDEESSSCVSCLRWFVFVFNLFFWLCGIVILGIGLWLAFDPDVTNYFALTSDVWEHYWAVYLMIGVGVLMTLLGFVGCCGALRESQCMLSTFFILLFIVFTLQLAAAIGAFTQQDALKAYVDDSMYDAVYQHYGRNVAYTQIVDKLQNHMGCCGVYAYQDWLHSYYTSQSRLPNPELGVGAASVGRVPESCCNDKGRNEYPGRQTSGDGDSADTVIDQCGTSFDKAPLWTYEPYLHREGCAQLLYTKLYSNLDIVIFVCVVVGILELFGMIASLLLCCFIGRRNEDDRKTGGYY